MNKTGQKVFLAFFMAVSLFVWQVTAVLGGSDDSDQYRDRVVSQLGEIRWLDQLSQMMAFKNSAYRNIQANSLGYAKAVILRMTDRFAQSGGDIAAINLALEDAISLLREGRDLISPQAAETDIEKVVAAYYGHDDMAALAALLDLYALILQAADGYNAQIAGQAEPVYLVPLASGSSRLFPADHLQLIQLPSRSQVEEEFLQERDRARRFGALRYPQRIEALAGNSLYQVLHQINSQK